MAYAKETRSVTSEEYLGVIIWKSVEPGSHLKWTARTSKGFVAADTKQGLKSLIRQAEGGV